MGYTHSSEPLQVGDGIGDGAARQVVLVHLSAQSGCVAAAAALLLLLPPLAHTTKHDTMTARQGSALPSG